jgi:hypothetical protein
VWRIELGFGAREQGLVILGAFWRVETTTLRKIIQEEYFSHFLAKPRAERAQIVIFGHSGAIGAIYFAL